MPYPSAAGPIGPLAWLPAGPSFGTLVHAVLEDVDFTATDLEEWLAVGIDRQLTRRALDLTPTGSSSESSAAGRTLLTEGLCAAIRSPLGPLCGDLALADLAVPDRLNEMSFESAWEGRADRPTSGTSAG